MTDLCSHKQPRTQCTRCLRGQLLADLAAVVDELLGQVNTTDLVPTAAVPTYKPPKKGKVPKRIRHETHEAGLLTQLAEAAGVRPTRRSYDEPTPTLQLIEAGPARGPRYGGDVTTGSKPGSRPPASLEAIDTLADIETALFKLRCDADTAAGLRTITRRRPIRGEIRHLTWLLETARHSGRPLLSDAWARRILRELRKQAAAARTTLSYVAPIASLLVACPDCGGTLRVRSDATSDVWCIGRRTIEGPALDGQHWPITVPCWNRWAQITWVTLFEEAEHARVLDERHQAIARIKARLGAA